MNLSPLLSLRFRLRFQQQMLSDYYVPTTVLGAVIYIISLNPIIKSACKIGIHTPMQQKKPKVTANFITPQRL